MSATLRFALFFERIVQTPARQVIDAHRKRLEALAEQGIVRMAGPFEGGGGLVVLDVRTEAEARAIADEDPFVLEATHRYSLRRWLQDIGQQSSTRAGT